MHLSVRLPKVEPDSIQPPTTCPLLVVKRKLRPCSGRHFKLHQVACDKALRDLRHSQVQAQRYPGKLDERPLSGVPAYLPCLSARGERSNPAT